MISLLLWQTAIWIVLIASAAGGVSLVVRTWLRNRHGLTAEDARRLIDAVEQLQHTLEDFQDDHTGFRRRIEERVGQLSGRVEFAERILGKGDAPRS